MPELSILQITTIVISLLTTGVFAGLAAGMLGIGGGIVIVPILYAILVYLKIDLSICMQVAVATSLSVIVVTGFSAVSVHYKYGFINKKLLTSWGVGAFIGAIAGVILGSYVNGDTLRFVFGFFGIAIALRMFFIRDYKTVSDSKVTEHRLLQLITATLIGTISTMVGIGGGVLSVPSMVFFGIDMYHATATSSALSMLIAIPGTIGFIITGWNNPNLPFMSLGYLNVLMFLIVTSSAMIATPTGVRYGRTVNQKKLRRIFAIVICISSVKMIV